MLLLKKGTILNRKRFWVYITNPTDVAELRRCPDRQCLLETSDPCTGQLSVFPNHQTPFEMTEDFLPPSVMPVFPFSFCEQSHDAGTNSYLVPDFLSRTFHGDLAASIHIRFFAVINSWEVEFEDLGDFLSTVWPSASNIPHTHQRLMVLMTAW